MAQDEQFYVTRDGRELSAADAHLLKQIDEKAEEVRALLDQVAGWHTTSWYEINNARTSLRQGFMWLRSVAARSRAF
ncbi:MAG: hypothetical protein ABI843_02315 [Dokdonella sp.]